jgi:prepilin-type N-terminal cleavage/methylation domain-containing protein
MRRVPPPTPASTGFTLIELLIVVVILLIVAGAISIIGTTALRREELNSISVGLAGWLEGVQRASRRLSPTGCEVVFTPGPLTPNTVIATASALDPLANPAADACGVPTEFRLPHHIYGDKLQLTVDSGENRISFTPRGTTTALSPLAIRVSHPNHLGARCVRLSAILGVVSIGTDRNSNDKPCHESSYDDAT